MEVRREVVWFAEEMEMRLKANDYKGGWKDCSPMWLLNRLKEEVRELEDELKSQYGFICHCCGHKQEPRKNEAQDIIREASDVANYAMMIADIVQKGEGEVYPWEKSPLVLSMARK